MTSEVYRGSPIRFAIDLRHWQRYRFRFAGASPLSVFRITIHQQQRGKSMKARVLVYFAAMCFAVFLGAQSPAPTPEPIWKPFDCPDDGFSVLFPSEPTMRKNDMLIGDSTVEMHSYIALLDHGALFVGFGDLTG